MRTTTSFHIVVLSVLVSTGAVHAQTGVNDDRVSLPEGPGSLEGAGENVAVDSNMGSLSYGVPILLPQGHEGATPSLRLTYASGGGAGLVGLGWDMRQPVIERMTNRGLPTYDEDDLFAAGGAEQLTRVDDGEPAVYRARFEGSWVRYKWFRRSEPGNDYWTAEFPNGGTAWYGADPEGAVVAESRLEGDAGTFRYGLVESWDVWEHPVRYTWARFGTTVMVTEIGWLYVDGTPRYRAALDYEARPDHVSDCKPGFCEVVTRRLSQVRILSGETQTGRWALTYHDEMMAGGLSLLASVTRHGADGSRYPVRFDFSYSESLGGVCDGVDCQEPFLVDMGSLGVSLRSGDATLVDLNGDALPDVVNTNGSGAHRVVLSRFLAPDDHSFGAATPSGVGTGATHALRAGRTQVLDVDGDGRADLLNSATGSVLENDGSGDWGRRYDLFQDQGDLDGVAFELDPEDGDLENIRFVDIDNDKRIDVIRSVGAGDQNITAVYRNEGAGGFSAVDGVERMPVGFESDRLQLADMNGDGLLDAVRVLAGALSYRLNLGWGQWGEDVVLDDLPFNDTEAERVELEDLNNDGLADFVLVRASELVYALSMNGTAFRAPVTVGEVGGRALPTRGDETTVLYADMNGSGSADVVWIDENGGTTYLELFPVQPNLLSRITNGLGLVNDIEYITAVQAGADAANAGEPWSRHLNFATTMVARSMVFDELTEIEDDTRYTYVDPFFDGEEKAFRGFARVTEMRRADATSESWTGVTEYDVGDGDPYRAGRPRSRQVYSDGEPVQYTEWTFDDCPVDDVPDPESLTFPVKFTCERRVVNTGQERAPEASWATTEIETAYDGYGNVVRRANLGITKVGGGACAPCTDLDDGAQGGACGEECLGDENYLETEFISPANTAGRWILGTPSVRREFGRAGGLVAEARYFYDGEAFVGLPQGQLTHGAPTRTQTKIAEGVWATNLRQQLDEHGNAIVQIGALGSVDDELDGRRLYTFDASGLNVTRTEIRVRDENDEPYSLVQTSSYDPLWNEPSVVTNWVVHRDGQAVSAQTEDSNTYDVFGRAERHLAPGDTIEDPSERYEYRLDEPGAPVVARRRKAAGGDMAAVTVRCFDGFGRSYQERTRVAEGEYIVSGFKVFGPSGNLRRGYSSYIAEGEGCDRELPEGVGYFERHYDGLGRMNEVRFYDAAETMIGRERVVHAPTYTVHYDTNDTDPDSPHFETPRRLDFDGLGRVVRITRTLAQGEDSVHRLTYDELGRFRSWVDPEGNEKIQTYDLGGRMVRVDDPDRGTIVNEYDAGHNVVRTTDGAGRVTRFAFDGQGREIARWDEADEAGTRVNYYRDFPRTCPAELCTFPAANVVESDFPVAGSERRGRMWFGLDSNENLVYEATSVLGHRFETRHEYDDADTLLSTTHPDGTTIRRQLDDGNRIAGIDGFVEAVVFDDLAQVREVTFSNGVRESFAFDGRTRMTEKRVAGPAGELFGWTFERDRRGNVLAVHDERPGDGPSRAASFEYDALGRLVRAHLDEGNGAHDEVVSYEYDLLDNLRSKTSTRRAGPGHIGAYNYDESRPHAVIRAGERSLAYDDSGGVIRNGDHEIERDFLGRIAVVTKDGERVHENIYGPGEERLLERSDDGTVFLLGPNFEIRDGVAITTVSLVGSSVGRVETTALAATVLSDIAPAGVPDGVIDVADAWIAHGDGASSPELLRAATARLLVGSQRRTWTHLDQVGSIAATTDEAGSVEQEATWYPFGATRSGTTVDGKAFGSEQSNRAGWVSYALRDYDPVLGRWLSPDPIFQELEGPPTGSLADTVGAYAFVGNNPATHRDQRGGFIGELFVLGAQLTYHIGGAVVGAAVGTGVSLYEKRRNSMLIRNRKPSGWSYFKAGAKGFFAGGVGGFIAPGSSTLKVVIGTGVADGLIRSISGGRLTNQGVLTASRTLAAVVSFGLTLGATALLTGGVSLVVAGVAAAWLGLKALHIGIKHRNGYRRFAIWSSGKLGLFSKKRQKWKSKVEQIQLVGSQRQTLQAAGTANYKQTLRAKKVNDVRAGVQKAKAAAGGLAAANQRSAQNAKPVPIF